MGAGDLHGVRGRAGRLGRPSAHVDEVHRAEGQQATQHDACTDRVVADGHHSRASDDDADDLGGRHRGGLELHPVADTVVDSLRDERHVQGEDGCDEQLYSCFPRGSSSGNPRAKRTILHYQRTTILLCFWYSNYFFEENV